MGNERRGKECVCVRVHVCVREMEMRKARRSIYSARLGCGRNTRPVWQLCHAMPVRYQQTPKAQGFRPSARGVLTARRMYIYVKQLALGLVNGDSCVEGIDVDAI